MRPYRKEPIESYFGTEPADIRARSSAGLFADCADLNSLPPILFVRPSAAALLTRQLNTPNEPDEIKLPFEAFVTAMAQRGYRCHSEITPEPYVGDAGDR